VHHDPHRMPPAHSSVHALQPLFKKKIRKLVGSGTQLDPRTWEANSQRIERSARACGIGFSLCCLEDDRRAMPPCNAWRKKPVSRAYSERSVRPNGLYLPRECILPGFPSFPFLFLFSIPTHRPSQWWRRDARGAAGPMPSASRCNTIFSFLFLFRFSFFFILQIFSYRVMYIYISV
jgi:hypothetical protein